MRESEEQKEKRGAGIRNHIFTIKRNCDSVKRNSRSCFCRGNFRIWLRDTADVGMVYAPFDGAIVQVSDTKHAVGLKSADGTEVLIHVGMDTVEMNGNGFTTFVKTGDNVKKAKS